MSETAFGPRSVIVIVSFVPALCAGTLAAFLIDIVGHLVGLAAPLADLPIYLYLLWAFEFTGLPAAIIVGVPTLLSKRSRAKGTQYSLIAFVVCYVGFYAWAAGRAQMDHNIYYYGLLGSMVLVALLTALGTILLQRKLIKMFEL